MFRSIVFTFYRANGTSQKITKTMFGDDEMIQWATDQFAEVNECGVTAAENGEQIAIAGNVQN